MPYGSVVDGETLHELISLVSTRSYSLVDSLERQDVTGDK